jgi:dihydrofolate reductase
MQISIIVAYSLNHVIGVGNQLPWHLPADLAHFKQLTLNHAIIMGRKTFESIGRPLPKRQNMVVSRDPDFHADGILIYPSIESAFDFCREQQMDQVFIIGGETIYRQTISMADQLYITKVHTHIDNGTAFFPEISTADWVLKDVSEHSSDDKHPFDYSFEHYVRLNPNNIS